MPLRTTGQFGPEAGRSGPVVVGSVPHDEPVKTAPGTVEMFGMYGYTRGPSEHVTGPSRYHTKPFAIEYEEQNVEYYQQLYYQPPTNVSRAPTVPQGRGMIPPSHRFISNLVELKLFGMWVLLLVSLKYRSFSSK